MLDPSRAADSELARRSSDCTRAPPRATKRSPRWSWTVAWPAEGRTRSPQSVRIIGMCGCARFDCPRLSLRRA
eukprot:10057736-Alexandrium_andersonii.AAC.1